MIGQGPPGIMLGRSSSAVLRTGLATRRRGRSDDEMELVRRIGVCSFLFCVSCSAHTSSSPAKSGMIELIVVQEGVWTRAHSTPDTPLGLEERHFMQRCACILFHYEHTLLLFCIGRSFESFTSRLAG